MSTYAKNAKGALVFAKDAERSVNYSCLECGANVRLKMGEERRAHFYHLNPSIHCRESGKSLEHLMTQFAILEAFRKKNREVILEKRFSEINRIADVACMEEKIIFEIQCSPMTAQEALERMRDYNLLGFQVVWIIHLKTFLKNKATAFEKILHDTPHYFTDINEEGEGDIFDLFSPIRKGYRQKASCRFPIDIEGIAQNTINYPFRKNWPLSFQGDILYQLKEKTLEEETRERLFYYLFVDKEHERQKRFSIPFFMQKGLFYVKIFFEEMLRNACSG